jgi:hypothetical protein
MTHKPFFLTVALVSLLALAGVFYWMSQKRQVAVDQPVVTDPVGETPVQTEPTTAIDTSDWKTYRDEEYGFEMKYPTNLEKTEQGLTPHNPPIGNPSSTQNTVWFSMDVQNHFSGKLLRENLNNVLDEELFRDPFWSSYIHQGNVKVSYNEEKINGVQLKIVKSILKQVPNNYKSGGLSMRP